MFHHGLKNLEKIRNKKEEELFLFFSIDKLSQIGYNKEKGDGYGG